MPLQQSCFFGGSMPLKKKVLKALIKDYFEGLNGPR